MPHYRILPHNPHTTPSNIVKNRENTLPEWIKSNAPATIFTDDMLRHKRGILVIHQDNQWHLHAGRGTTRTPIKLKNLHQDIFHLIQTSQLVRGYYPFHTLLNAWQQVTFNNTVACHVAAASMTNLDALRY